MKLSEWAKKYGLCYQTAYSLFRRNQLPAKAVQLETGTILVLEDEIQNTNKTELKTYIYARVSSNNKKDDLVRQAKRCEDFCLTKGWEIEKIVKEISSGMNDKRKGLIKLLDNNPKRIVVEHKDRLTRFGFSYFEHLLPLLGYELIVINRDTEEEADLMKDFVAVITSFCCRLYGLRKGSNKSNKIKKILDEQKE